MTAMIQEHVTLPAHLTLEDIEDWMASVEGLGFQYMGNVRSRPGSHHWHIRHDSGSGVVDCTLVPEHGVILAVHANRRGTWAGDALPALIAALRSYAWADP